MKPRYQSIEVYFINNEYIRITIYAVGMISIRDPLLDTVVLKYDVNNIELAQQVRKSLQKTRGLSMSEFQDLNKNIKDVMAIGEKEDRILAAQYGYKNINTMRKEVRCLSITSQHNEIELTSKHQDSLDGYHATKQMVTTYPESISDEELGQKIREAFKLCTSKYDK